ncbi:MAG: hypothetical protein AAGJ96_01100 [Pseudomonadota bacterium]
MPSNCTTNEIRRCSQTRDEGYSRCAREQERRTRECKEGYESRRDECTRRSTRRRKSCRSWSRWTRWLCVAWTWVTETFCAAWTTIVEWVCTAWATVVEWLCVAYEWVSNVVCVAWQVIRLVVCAVVDYTVAVIGALVEVVASTVGLILDVMGAFLQIIISIPVIGRIIDIVWAAVTEFIWRVGSLLIEAIFELLGIMPEKKLRVCVLMPSQLSALQGVDPVLIQNAPPTGTSDNLSAAVSQLQATADILRRECNIRLVPAAGDRHLFEFTGPNSDDPTATRSWVTVISVTDDILVADCNWDAFVDNVGLQGTRVGVSSAMCLRGSARKVIGYGPPVKVLIVQAHKSGSAGCGLSGFLVDHVTVNAASANPPSNLDTMVHEIGHVCSLTHRDDEPNNLMAPGTVRQGQNLTDWQRYVIRTSRFVTYF